MLEVRTFVVQETRTTIAVLWQDGTRETLNATETIPYLNPDEYDCWYVQWKSWKSQLYHIYYCFAGQAIMSSGRPKIKDVLPLCNL